MANEEKKTEKNKPKPCPKWLSDAAKKEWRRIAKIFAEEEKEFTDKDLKALEAYCTNYAKWQKCEQIIDEKFIDLADSPSYTGVFNSIFSKCKKKPQIAYSCNDYILQGKLISLGLGVSFVASVTWTNSSLPENISLLHIDGCPHFRSIYYQPLGSFRSETQRIFEHQLEEYFKNLNH